MNQETAKPPERTATCCPDMTEGMGFDARRTESCPMATMCRGAMGRMRIGPFLALLGLALLVIGALILFEPKALIWLIAGTSILMGFGMLAAAVFAPRRAARVRNQ